MPVKYKNEKEKQQAKQFIADIKKSSKGKIAKLGPIADAIREIGNERRNKKIS